MNWDRLRIFYIVATEGGISRASQVVNVTQSALSRQISQLEQELKQVLFLRMTKGLILTDAGKKLLPIAESLYKKAKKAEDALLFSTQEAAGSLTLIASTTLHEFWLMSHLANFSEKHPEIQLSAIASNGADSHHKIREDVYLQISSFPSESNDMISKFLCSYDLHLYGSSNYISHNGMPKNIKELQNHRFIAIEGSESLMSKESETLISKDPKKNSAFISIEGEHSALKALQNNMGLAILPAYVAATDESLVQILLEDATPSSNAINKFICYPKRLEKHKRIKVLESFLLSKAAEDF